jgi:hypothetical protein
VIWFLGELPCIDVEKIRDVQNKKGENNVDTGNDFELEVGDDNGNIDILEKN